MPILNYSTTIPVKRTIAEIQDILVKAGAQAVMINYTNGLPERLSFTYVVDGEKYSFQLPTRAEGVFAILCKEFPRTNRQKLAEQAQMIAWRNVREWIQVQLAMIRAGHVSFDEVFMPYLLLRSGVTVYQQFKNERLLPGMVEE